MASQTTGKQNGNHLRNRENCLFKTLINQQTVKTHAWNNAQSWTQYDTSSSSIENCFTFNNYQDEVATKSGRQINSKIKINGHSALEDASQSLVLLFLVISGHLSAPGISDSGLC